MSELIKLVHFAIKKSLEDKQLALATIVHTVGSSYRKKGTQMVIAEDLTFEGSVSGGCVEKEVLRKTLQVFATKQSVIFEYDGRYKLGCNGTIYVLVDLLEKEMLGRIGEKIMAYGRARKTFRLGIQRDEAITRAAIYFLFDDQKFHVCKLGTSGTFDRTEELVIPPQYQLIIIGGEHDSVVLANIADQAGIATLLITKESFQHELPDTIKVAYLEPEELSAAVRFDEQTAIVLMTHSLSRDLSFLVKLVQVKSAYLGILGPEDRKETILNDLMSFHENLFLIYPDKLQMLRGPVGLRIGAKTPQEISIAILSEIIAVFNQADSELR